MGRVEEVWGRGGIDGGRVGWDPVGVDGGGTRVERWVRRSQREGGELFMLMLGFGDIALPYCPTV